ncbi:MAG: tRNA (N(6)-L-threonylcarbamoyladenosine(37)-C(2))-methylthiotransferase MtaB [Saprospiraceae bacterium]|nr:tRNA (N(6)-L-threonylcarbamoyladenosine(37)-C(2))-methylthiotransferase MtaB [Saprospiraceae bacterium]
MATPKSIAFHTLGCKLNYSETSALRNQFEQAGYTVVNYNDPAEFYVLNTCSVTDFADKKCRYEVRRALRHNADAKVIVIGCYAQLKPQEIAAIEGVDLVLGAGEKFNLLKHVESMNSLQGEGTVLDSEIQSVNSFIDAFSFGDRTRSFLKVQDGCDYKCSFCTIPLARGKSRSDTVDNVVANAKKIGEMGVKEIVLTGVNIGDFGNGTEVLEGIRPKKEDLFIDLIKALDRVDNIERFRISSIEPNLCSEEIIEFVASSKRFMPHFHMPLQSGSNEMLKLMRRRYKRELYADRVARIKDKMPHCCIGVDVIVGFPGETEAHFKETFEFLLDLDISYLHVFTYSERENTLAATMPGIVEMGERKRRNKQLRILSDKKRHQFYLTQLQSSRPVLFETEITDGQLTGFTDNYVKVITEASNDMRNSIHEVHLTEINSQGTVTGVLDTVVV